MNGYIEFKNLTQEYNHYLKRLYNGEIYCEKHADEVDKWLPEIQKILYVLERLIEEIQKLTNVSEEEIINGFKI